MTTCGNIANQRGETVGNPPQDKERGPHLMPIQQAEYPCGGIDNSRLQLTPTMAGDVAFEGGDLEVVFHVNGKRVGLFQ